MQQGKLIVVPEFNYVGWLARKWRLPSTVSPTQVIGGPRVYGGQSMPVELIVDEVESGVSGKKSTNVAMSQIMGGVNPEEVAHFMRSI